MAETRLPRPPEVARVLRTITATARRHAVFDPGSRVVVAVSGGPDSICLLHSLVRLRRLFEVDVACFHFDHRLRTGSERDARYVRAQAQNLGVPFVLRAARTKPRRGESVEAWARTVRYEALDAVLEELGGGVGAVAHTADDQAETVLLAALRGAGIEALSGMRPVTRPIVRPLLEVTREETLAFCRALRLRPRKDPMNEDRAYMRVALRKDVVPFLERRLGRGVRRSLVRTARLLHEDATFLDELAAGAATDVVMTSGDERRLAAEALRRLPGPIASRIVKRELEALGVPAEAAHVDAILALASGPPGRRATLPRGLSARRDREYVRLSRPSPGSTP